MDVSGFFVESVDWWADFTDRVEKYFKENNNAYEYYIDTNEAILYERASDVMKDYKVVPLTEGEAKVFQKYFGYGFSEK